MPAELVTLVTSFSYALGYIYIRRCLRSVSSDTATMITLLVNGILYLILLAGTVAVGGLPPLQPAALWWFALAGLMGPLLGRFTLYASMSRLGAPRSSSLKALAPIYTALLAAPLLGESMGLLAWLGLVGAVAGVALVTWHPQGKEQAGPTAGWGAGVWLGLTSAFFFGAVNIARKKGLVLLPSVALASTVAGLAALAFFALYLALQGNLREKLRVEQPKVRRDLILAGLLNALAIFVYFYSLQHGRVAVVATVANTEPLFVLPLARWLLRQEDPLNIRLVAGVLLTVFSVALILLWG